MKLRTLIWSSCLLIGQSVYLSLCVADTHVLIMGIGSYQDPKISLQGVDQVREHALFIAKSLGVTDEYIP